MDYYNAYIVNDFIKNTACANVYFDKMMVLMACDSSDEARKLRTSLAG